MFFSLSPTLTKNKCVSVLTIGSVLLALNACNPTRQQHNLVEKRDKESKMWKDVPLIVSRQNKIVLSLVASSPTCSARMRK